MLPIGQMLWLKELESYREFPPLQIPASYNLDQVMEQIKNAKTHRANRRCLQTSGRPTGAPASSVELDRKPFPEDFTMNRRWTLRLAMLGLLAPAALAPAVAQQAQKPNIVVIMGDDIGYWNISAYNRGMMGYRTPNIDRIANEGAIFTDYYGQQSCTAGRAAFITGQSPLRTGLLKVGLPAAKEGLSALDPTIAELLKPQGYATGTIRQEPSRRPQRISADGSRLRRVLRQSLSPERRG